MSSFKYAISGGTGWLGREVIRSLIDKRMISSPEDICVFSSQSAELYFPEFGRIVTRPFLENDSRKIQSVDGFFHLAFLTRNLLTKYGFSKYVEINNQLTAKAIELIRVTNPTFVVNVSSGAVFSRESRELEKSIHANPYGYLKLSEESLLIEACDKLSINLCIGRLWGATGSQMPINRAYAISDFISQAIFDNRIMIDSSNLVFRRYCDASEFMVLLFLAAQKSRFTALDSGGPKVEIGDLAELIAKEIGTGLEIIRKVDDAAAPDDYYSRSKL
jgi:nucleoside-diphosphate-sugar epimerase